MIASITVAVVFVLAFSCLELLISACRDPQKLLEKPQKQIKIITVNDDVDIVLKKLLKYNSYKLEAIDIEKGLLIFGEDATITSWGFFYPVKVVRSNEVTNIEISILSKAFQVGPIVRNKYQKFINNVLANVFID